MKKLLSIGLAVLLLVGISLTVTGCPGAALYCDPRGKEWYNDALLPNIENPYNELYDGSYLIKIDDDGKVEFKLISGEVLQGNITTSVSDNLLTRVSIQFDNGETATGYCKQNDDGRVLKIFYGKWYTFSDKRQLSKVEFDLYRSQLVDFITNVYNTGVFSTEQEIENNSLYKQFTNYYQIDPCCGGPITYRILEKATIEEIDLAEYDGEITLNINGESVVSKVNSQTVVSIIRNGQIENLELSDITQGECVVSRLVSCDGEMFETYSINIFYVQNI